jgi:hypothetical protein
MFEGTHLAGALNHRVIGIYSIIKERVMVSSRVLLGLSCVIFALLIDGAHGQATDTAVVERQKVQSLWESTTIKIDGDTTPDLVPFNVRMQAFFQRYKRPDGDFQKALRPLLTADEHTALISYATSVHEKDLKASQESYSKNWMSIASQAEFMNGLELAFSVKKISAEADEMMGARYMRVLSQLSLASRKVVHNFAYKNVRPKVTMEDPVAVATRDPDYYKTHVMAIYKAKLSGKLPPLPTLLAPALDSEGSAALRAVKQ